MKGALIIGIVATTVLAFALGSWKARFSITSWPQEFASPSFKAVYPHFTTMTGNKFRFRGGDPVALRNELQKLLSAALKTPVKTSVES